MSRPVLCELKPDETHVWSARLSDELLATLPEVLDEAERQRAKRFVFDRHATHFRCARTILRLLLARYLNDDPASIQFTYGPHGKPGVEQLRFNVSHSHDLALFAFTRLPAVGVDLELRRPVPSAEAIASHFFSPAEHAALVEQPDVGTAFLRCWTRKEALVKAIGDGLAIDLASFDVSLDPTDARLMALRGPLRRAADWSLYDISTDDAIAALALYLPRPAAHQLRRFSFSTGQPVELNDD